MGLFAVMLFASLSKAASESYKLSSDSELRFRVRNFGITSVEGQFKDFSGGFQIDEKFENSKATAEIKTASVTTENEERDTHLKNSDFFDVQNHPSILFTSTTITGSPESFDMNGELAIKRITKPVKLKCSRGNVTEKTLSFKCDGEIDRTHFGITHGATVGDRVKLEFRVTGTK